MKLHTSMLEVVFCIHLETKVSQFTRKNLRGDFIKKVSNFGYCIKMIFIQWGGKTETRQFGF